jgi:GNAT superfamily N-acetyltransferase
MALSIERVQDLEQVWPVLTALLQELHEHHQPFWPRDFLPGWQERWREFLTSGDERLVLIAREDGEAAGYLNGAIRRNPGLFAETYADIDDAYVRPVQRRRGVGSQMLRRFEEWAQSRGVVEVRLNVVAANGVALSFWQKSGFAPLSYRMTKHLGPGS